MIILHWKISSLFSSHLFVLQKSSHVFVLQKSVMNSMVNKDVETKSTYYESGQHAKRSESSNRQTVYNLGPIIEERNWNMLSQLIRLMGKYTGDSRERRCWSLARRKYVQTWTALENRPCKRLVCLQALNDLCYKPLVLFLTYVLRKWLIWFMIMITVRFFPLGTSPYATDLL